MDDAALAAVIQQAQRGEAQAFDRLVDLFAARVAGFLYRMTGSRQESEDLVQEVFLRLVRMIGSYQHDGRFEPWLFRIAANLARDRVRRARRTPSFLVESFTAAHGTASPESGHMGQLAGTSDPVDARLLQDETICELNAALRRLPEAEREVIMLRHFSQLSFREIADLTGTPLGTALARAHRGLARLRELMTSEPQSPVLNRRPTAAPGVRS